MPSYVLLWNPDEWPHANILRMLREVDQNGITKEPWRFMSHKSGKAGDDVFLFKTGAPPRGIFGHGCLTGIPFKGVGSDGKPHWMFEVHFDQLVDPLTEFLMPEALLAMIPAWSAQRGSGNSPLDQNVAEHISRHIDTRGTNLTAASEKEFDSRIRSLPETERKQIVLQRIGQDIFRKSLILFWSAKCCISGLAQTELLRASHAKDWSRCDNGRERLDVYNGLLLAAHLDAAFDAGLIGVNTNGVVQLSPNLNAESVKALGLENPIKIGGITSSHHRYLDWHMKNKFQQS